MLHQIVLIQIIYTNNINMNGKKIAFIVVSVLAVGTIGYILYKRRKSEVVSKTVFGMPKEELLKNVQALKQKSIQKAIEQGKTSRNLYTDATPDRTYTNNLYE